MAVTRNGKIVMLAVMVSQFLHTILSQQQFKDLQGGTQKKPEFGNVILFI